MRCEHGIVGIRGDDGGFVDVDGKVIAAVVIADSYFNMVRGMVINTSGRPLKADITLPDPSGASEPPRPRHASP